MTVKELIDVLGGFSPEKQIILQKDPEGNGYSPLVGADDDAVYIADSGCRGEVYSGEDKETYGEEGIPVVVLWPNG